MNVKEPSDAAYGDADDLELEVDLDEVPDAAQQGSAIVGGGADAAKAYVAPIALPARVESNPPPPAEGKVRIDSRVDPRRMPTVKISARELAAGAIPGWRPGGPAVGAKPAHAAPRPDWMVAPETPAPRAAAPAPAAPAAPVSGAMSGVLWAFAIVLTVCAIVAVGAVLWVELSHKGMPAAASSAEAAAPSATSSAIPELAPVVPAVTTTAAPAPARSGSKRPAKAPRTGSTAR
jgi:hypothetical protein